ncbi:hypothetical protein M569_05932 [Genlisea aurea]|uniref:Transcription factor VOZ1 n=1 Tax=Genlisea aurea TaxID=192259 RepID=S8CVB2_9LAMI|nr:hypothetical protein M569_05932 [Genlisea aurea]
MVKGSKTSDCKSASHQHFKDRAKNLVDDLQGMFINLQSARKESRSIDVAVLEEQVHQMLREWKAELNEVSPASSLQQGGSLGFSSDICRLLHLYEEEDDATSALAAPKSEPDAHNIADGSNPKEQGNDLGVANMAGSDEVPSESQLDFHPFEFQSDFEQQFISSGYPGSGFGGQYGYDQIFPPPSAFLGPKCALWDCPRPAFCLDWSQKTNDYCSMYHAGLASSEGYRGRPPIVRPGGIGLKDNLLFAALDAKATGKDVGIPECEGAATAKSPWNAPELFDVGVLEGESMREWVFFDKARRAFESGNRKQRSLPDYNGRGWHESRKQVMNEVGGLKRSYYMDPQPMERFEWHLYEYEIKRPDCDCSCALYRLEVKRADGKKSPKGKLSLSSNECIADLQKQMRKLSADGKGRGKVSSGGSPVPSPNPTAQGFDYLVEDVDNGYYNVT